MLAFGNRLNALNVGEFLKIYDTLEKGEEPFIIRLTTEDVIIDEYEDGTDGRIKTIKWSGGRMKQTGVQTASGGTVQTFTVSVDFQENFIDTNYLGLATWGDGSTNSHNIMYVVNTDSNTLTISARHINASSTSYNVEVIASAEGRWKA